MQTDTHRRWRRDVLRCPHKSPGTRIVLLLSVSGPRLLSFALRFEGYYPDSCSSTAPPPRVLISPVLRALQAQGNPQIREAAKKALDVQEAALKAVADEAFHGAIDGKTRELAILPRVCWLVVKGTAVRVKVNALLCLSKTFHFFMVRAVVDKVSSLRPFVLLAGGRSYLIATAFFGVFPFRCAASPPHPAARSQARPLAGGPLFWLQTPREGAPSRHSQCSGPAKELPRNSNSQWERRFYSGDVDCLCWADHTERPVIQCFGDALCHLYFHPWLSFDLFTYVCFG